MRATPDQATTAVPVMVDRYAIYGELDAGGMATVHLARLQGAGGFRRTVAVKRLLPNLLRDEVFSLMLMDEARVAARIRHANVVSTLDVVQTERELLLVMDYVHGESLAKLSQSTKQAGETVPIAVATKILVDALHGLEAAHEATDDFGRSLNLVHRDVSPQNLLVGVDGTARVADFGIAKAAGRLQATQDSALKGKLAYMSPEHVSRSTELTRQSDVFSATIVLWETLTGHRLFDGVSEAQVVLAVMAAPVPSASSFNRDVSPELEAVLAKGLARDLSERFATAREMALALEAAESIASASEVGAWVARIAASSLARRAALLESIERSASEDAVDADARIDSDRQLDFATRVKPVADSVAPPARKLAPPELLLKTDSTAVTDSLPRSRKGRNWMAITGVFAFLLGGVLSWWALRSLVETPKAAPAAPRELPASAPPAPESLAAVPVAQSSSQVETPAPGSARPQTIRPKTAPKRRPNCDPPYSIDASGRRIFKVECM